MNLKDLRDKIISIAKERDINYRKLNVSQSIWEHDERPEIKVCFYSYNHHTEENLSNHFESVEEVLAWVELLGVKKTELVL